ncbi:MAG: hypothetical protein AB8G86_18545, partial [Saprospiraceae bacterium]
MEFEIEKYNAHGIIKDIARKLGTKSRTDCLEEIIELPKEYGKGKIVGFSFSDGVSLLIFNCQLKDDWILVFENDAPAPLQFNFNMKGNIKHFFNRKSIQYQLNPLQGTITAHPAGSSQTFQLPHNTDILFNSLLIDRKKYSRKIKCILDQMPASLADIFTDTDAKESFFYQSNYSLSVAGCIKKITQDKNEGLVRSTFLEGKVLELFSKQVKQYQDDLNSPGRQVMLRKFDLEKIKMAKDLLVKDLVNPPTIEELAKQVGINRQKLKMGFKKVYDKT